jgi:uncharacterized protein
LTLTLVSETLHLLPERAVYWPARETLFIADLHVGKAASFRAAGSAIPRGTTSSDLDRLTKCINRTGAQRLVILGDLYHDRAGQVSNTMDVLFGWRELHPGLAVEVVRGNHDLRACPSPDGLRFLEHDTAFLDGPFVLAHHPVPSDEGYVLAGHIHPGYTLRGSGGEKLRLPCFHIGRQTAVLPAFGSFTGLAAVRRKSGDRVFVIAEDEVVEVRAR